MGTPFDSRQCARDRVLRAAALYADALTTLRVAGDELRTVTGADTCLRELYDVRSQLDGLIASLRAPARLALVDLEPVSRPYAEAAHNAAEAAREQLAAINAGVQQ